MPAQQKDSVVFTVKTQRTTHKRAKQIAGTLGFSLNSIMNAFLLQLIREKRIDMRLQKEHTYDPSSIEQLDQEVGTLKQEVKTGKVKTYKHSQALRKALLKD